MTSLRPVRGTRDFLPAESDCRRHIETVAAERARIYGFGEISTPVMEFTPVFARTLGDTSDIVTKEMYTFLDRSGESITLRPENTAGIVRAFISNKLTQQLPLKLFYRGPMFRYERPQKGRLRQFHQIGVELLGVPQPIADVEVIALAADLLAQLGLADTVVLELNSLGDTESRQAYRTLLVSYLERQQSRLSEDSRLRLTQNPLRILDSKDPEDREVVASAPPMSAALTPASRTFFGDVCAGLVDLGIPFRINERLVRGLDYYCHTAFEFVTEALGAQGTVLAGGRYDRLVEQMGGPPTPGTGWAAGVERLMMLVSDLPPPQRPVAVLPQSDAEMTAALGLAQRLRQAGIVTDFSCLGSVSRRMKAANRINARAVVIVGADELARHAAAFRDMDTGAQEEVSLADLEMLLAKLC
jgi:histidyl-tRNA synthetase